METILIIGGSGFIGSNFIRRIMKRKNYRVVNFDALTYAGNPDNLIDIEKNPRYTFVKGDIRIPKNLTAVFKRYRPEYVINFAAETHVDRSIHESPAVFLQTNAAGVLNILEAVRDYPVKKFLHVSTDEVYGTLSLTGGKPFTEASPLRPNSPYSASKAAGDLICRAYFETWGLPIVITRCSNNFGPYQYPEKLIPFFVLRAMKGETLTLYGDGKNVRDWIYVEDHCNALELALFKAKPGSLYNIGATHEVSNLEIAQRIADYFKLSRSKITFIKDRPGHDRRYALNALKIKKELGWQPRAQFDTVFKQTIEWYEQHSAWINKLNIK